MRKKQNIYMAKKTLNSAAKAALAEAEALTAADNALANANQEWEEKASQVKEEANVLAEAVNAMDKPFEEKPFIPRKKDQPLFDEIHALVEAQNEMDEGWAKANHIDFSRPKEENETLAGVLVDKIEEEHSRLEEERFKDDVVANMEEQL